MFYVWNIDDIIGAALVKLLLRGVKGRTTSAGPAGLYNRWICIFCNWLPRLSVPIVILNTTLIKKNVNCSYPTYSICTKIIV